MDGIRQVAGNLLNFLSWLGFHIPKVAITSWIGRMMRTRPRIGTRLRRTSTRRKILDNLVRSALRLACALREQWDKEGQRSGE